MRGEGWKREVRGGRGKGEKSVGEGPKRSKTNTW